jgi:formylglycine-generating enzyme required for sulfatase activity
MRGQDPGSAGTDSIGPSEGLALAASAYLQELQGVHGGIAIRLLLLVRRAEALGVEADWPMPPLAPGDETEMVEKLDFHFGWFSRLAEIHAGMSAEERERLPFPAPPYTGERLTRHIADWKALEAERSVLDRLWPGPPLPRPLEGLLGYAEGSHPSLERYRQELWDRRAGLTVHCRGGHFFMGAGDSGLLRAQRELDDGVPDDERPVHSVLLRRSFLIATFPVTMALYNAVTHKNPPEAGTGSCPREGISWIQAVRFCNLLSDEAGYSRVYTDTEEAATVGADWTSEGFRLPTEAEWEFSAKTGVLGPTYRSQWAGFRPLGRDGPAWPGIEESAGEVAWFAANSGGRPHPVRQKRPNAWGLHDMSGNVHELVWDRYGPYPRTDGMAYYSSDPRQEAARLWAATSSALTELAKQAPVLDPVGPSTGSSRVARGGSYASSPAEIRTTARLEVEPGKRIQGMGMRLCRTVQAPM